MNLLFGDFITDIEDFDGWWWTGVGPRGETGFFPCKSFVCVFRFLTTELWFSVLC